MAQPVGCGPFAYGSLIVKCPWQSKLEAFCRLQHGSYTHPAQVVEAPAKVVGTFH